MRSSVRRSVVGVVLAGSALLTACGGPAGDSGAPVSEAAATGSAAVSPDTLRDALVPASAFGDDAPVVGLSRGRVGALPPLAGLPDGAKVDPPLCGTALEMLSGR